MTTDLAPLAALVFAAGITGGVLGGLAVFAAGLRWLRASHIEIRQQRVVYQVEPVTLPIVVAQPDPITVPIVTAPAPSVAELGARILVELPDTGPRALARILACSTSTASMIVERHRETANGVFGAERTSGELPRSVPNGLPEAAKS